MASVQTIKQKMEQMEIDFCDDDITRIMQYAKSKEKGGISDAELMNFLNRQ